MKKVYIEKEKKTFAEAFWRPIGQIVIDNGIKTICDHNFSDPTCIFESVRDIRKQNDPGINSVEYALGWRKALSKKLPDGVFKIKAKMRNQTILELRIKFD